MNDTPFIHSDHLVWLVNNTPQHNLFKGHCQFKQLPSGLSVHGGDIRPSQTLRIGRLVDRYVNLIVLLEGHLRFAINQQRLSQSFLDQLMSTTEPVLGLDYQALKLLEDL